MIGFYTKANLGIIYLKAEDCIRILITAHIVENELEEKTREKGL